MGRALWMVSVSVNGWPRSTWTPDVVRLADRVIERGWVALADGLIAEVGEGSAPAGSEDVAGDLLMPGLVELHTDHLEAHYVPRPKVFWDPIAAATQV